ncbi:Cof-type HAD-IIB family hydrolase [Lacticaseibacillus hulanensis]|uniref:Cof-type HAD-IIB family hydrolase n=1 Tax=Lacticaseibacillus hulanensis TaxID=2493111 RepID=UPI001F4D93A3|nr:Cof-type HAD-IIB family hydrolase [Lacticaseibacillus hulanensis]
MIDHIFSDMDGTLLNPDGHITAATVSAIKQAQIPVTLVSARAPLEMAASIQALGLHEPQIAFNGGLIFQPSATGINYIQERPIATATANQIVTTIERSLPAVSVSYYDRTRWYAGKLDEGIAYEQRLTGQMATITPSAQTFAQQRCTIFKIMFITFDSALMGQLRAKLDAMHLAGVSVQQSGTAYLEITSSGAKKSHGIRYILERQHLDAANTAGFGDGHNDLPMLEMVGLPVVMGNALPEIKAVAQYVTKTNAADGVAYALKHYPAFQRTPK